jgi:hypothetical protein
MKDLDRYLNVAKSVVRLRAGELFNAQVEGGFSRKPVSQSGTLVTDRRGMEIFVPDFIGGREEDEGVSEGRRVRKRQRRSE